MRALVDTNIIMDLLLDRQPFAQEAVALWHACEQGRFEGYMSALTPVHIFSIARTVKGSANALQIITDLLAVLRVCALDQAVLQAATALPFTDYEDAVQRACAVANQLDAIITRNPTDYASARLAVFAPADFLSRLPPHTAR